MKKIFSIAKTLLLLLFRRGAGWGMLLLSATLAIFIFFATNSDNNLVNELHLRIKYSLYAFTLVLNISLMYLACVSLRKDIDERRFHTISAAPVHRAQIWLGKFIGLLSFGFIIFLFSSAAIAVSCIIFISRWNKPEDKKLLAEKFYNTYYVCMPDLANLQEKVNIEYKKRLQEYEVKHAGHNHALGEPCYEAEHEHEKKNEHKEAGHVHGSGGGHNHDELEGAEWRGRKYMLDEVRKEKQIISPGQTREWDFKWDAHAAQGDFILLRFKIYTNKRRNKVRGTWKVLDKTGKSVWTSKFADYPFLPHELKIPLNVVPTTKQLTIAFQETGSSHVIFPIYHGGLKLLYNSGGLLKNFLLLSAFSILHMGILIALALTFASIFSFSVAIFVTMVTYTTGLFANFFTNILQDLYFHDESIGRTIFTAFLKIGLWITKSTKAPPVNDMFSSGISIPASDLISTWGSGYLIYLVLVLLIGIWTLTRKEIDKILQT